SSRSIAAASPGCTTVRRGLDVTSPFPGKLALRYPTRITRPATSSPLRASNSTATVVVPPEGAHDDGGTLHPSGIGPGITGAASVDPTASAHAARLAIVVSRQEIRLERSPIAPVGLPPFRSGGQDAGAPMSAMV